MRWLVTLLVVLTGCDVATETVEESSMAIRGRLVRGALLRPSWGYSLGRDIDAGRIMCMGDSLTMGANTPSHDGWRRAFHIGLITAGVRHTMTGAMLAEGTMTTPDGLHEGHPSHNITMLTALVPGILAAHPADIVMLHIGTVDVAEAATAADMLVDLGDCLDAIHAVGAPRIVLQQIIPQGPPSGGNNQIVIDYNAGMPALVATKRAAGLRVALVDQYTGVVIGDHSTDGVHVTDEALSNQMGARNVQGVIAVMGL